MKSKLADKQRLNHIIEACNNIITASKEFDEERFVNDFIVRAAVCNFIMIIGEAASKLSEEFKNANKQFDWKVIKGMRNIIVHEYFGIDYSRVWSTVEHDIPKLKSDCINAIKEL